MDTLNSRMVASIGLNIRMIRSLALTKESTPMVLFFKDLCQTAKSMVREPTPSQAVQFGKETLSMIFFKEMVLKLRKVDAIELFLRTMLLNLLVRKLEKITLMAALKLQLVGMKAILLMEKPMDMVSLCTQLASMRATCMKASLLPTSSMARVLTPTKLARTREPMSENSKTVIRLAGVR